MSKSPRDVIADYLSLGISHDGAYSPTATEMLSVLDAAGYVILPKELTPELLARAVPDEDKSGAPYCVDRYIFNELYRDMIAAAQEPK